MFMFDLFNSWVESKPGLDIELLARQANINKLYLNQSRVILKQLNSLMDPSIKHAYCASFGSWSLLGLGVNIALTLPSLIGY